MGRTASGTKVNIEMQVNSLAAMDERSVYYWARNYADQAAIQEAMEVEDVFTKDEVAKRSYEKAEKFRRDQAAQLRYATEEGRQEGREEGILGTIVALKSLNLDKRTIALKLVEVFGLDDKAANGYVEANW